VGEYAYNSEDEWEDEPPGIHLQEFANEYQHELEERRLMAANYPAQSPPRYEQRQSSSQGQQVQAQPQTRRPSVVERVRHLSSMSSDSDSGPDFQLDVPPAYNQDTAPDEFVFRPTFGLQKRTAYVEQLPTGEMRPVARAEDIEDNDGDIWMRRKFRSPTVGLKRSQSFQRRCPSNTFGTWRPPNLRLEETKDFIPTNNPEMGLFNKTKFAGGAAKRRVGDQFITKPMIDKDRANYLPYTTGEKQSPFPPYNISGLYYDPEDDRRVQKTSTMKDIGIDDWMDNNARYNFNTPSNNTRRRFHSQAQYDPIPPQTQRRHSIGQDYSRYKSNPPSPLVNPTPRSYAHRQHSANDLHSRFTFDEDTRRNLGYK